MHYDEVYEVARGHDGVCQPIGSLEPGCQEVAVDFEIVGPIHAVETIAVGRAIREIKRLRRRYGPGRWRKRRGVAKVRLRDDTIHTAEVHWYEAHGIGRREIKIKFPLLD